MRHECGLTVQLLPQPPSWKGDYVHVFCSHGGFHFCEILLPPSTQELLRGGSSSPHMQGLIRAPLPSTSKGG